MSFKDVATKEVVTFKAGESMAFEVDIQGEPPAHDIIWSLGGKELTDGGVGVKIDNTKPYKSTISVDGLTRKDCGALDCTATNMEGIKKFLLLTFLTFLLFFAKAAFSWYTPPIAEILCVKNVGAFVVCGFLMK